MAWTIYRSSDASAPVLTGNSGSLIPVLDAVLVNGYGSQPAAGWEKVYSSGSLRAVYRPSTGSVNRLYYRFIDDLGTPLTSQSFCDLTIHDSLNSLNGTGSAVMPTNYVDPFRLRKSYTTGSTPRDWIIGADDKTVIMFIKSGVTLYPSTYAGTYFGEFYSYKPNDQNKICIIGRRNGLGTNISEYLGLYVTQTTTYNAANGTLQSSLIWKNYDNSLIPISMSQVCSTLRGGGSLITGHLEGWLEGTNPVDGNVWVSEIPLVTTKTSNCIRGHLRGLWQGLFTTSTSFPSNYQFTGSGDLTGKILEIIPIHIGQETTNVYTSSLCLEITEPSSSI